MKLGVFTVPLGGLPLDEACAFLASYGVQMVEIGCGGCPGTAHCNAEELLQNDQKCKDFLDTIQSIPLERLTGDKIQIKWMMLKYPEAARIAYAVDGLPLQWHLKRWYPLARRYAGYWNRESSPD